LLAGRVAPPDSSASPPFGALAWHEHLLACTDCRELLAAEEALEQLLASLPVPKLPRALAERVLSRLEPLRASDAALDALLDLTSDAPAPAELGRRLLAKLEMQRGIEMANAVERAEQRLDHLLERVDAPRVPARLAAQILAGLESKRERVAPRALRPVRVAHAKTVAAKPIPTRPAARRWVYALAASLAIACGIAAWMLSSARHDVVDGPDVAMPSPMTSPGVAPSPSKAGSPEKAPALPDANEPPQELLASLDLLESWDLVTDDSLDARLNTLDNFDELLLSIDADSSATDNNQNDATPSTEPPSKG